MKVFVTIILLMISNLFYAQQLIWKHLEGPMGGIIGDLAINSKGEIYAGVYPNWNVYSGLYKSTDNGDTWNKVVTQFDDFEVYAIFINKADHIWVGTNFQGRIYRSTDNGQTWENKMNGYDTGECWAFGESKDGVLFAGDGQYIQLYRSTDYGEKWELSANLRPLVFCTDSNNVVYAGTHDGLFATTDNGISWAQNNFLTDIPVSSILIDTNNNIYCGTGYYDNGNGVFYSSDGGVNWIQLGLAGKVVLSLAFNSEGNIFAGTLNDGLFKTTDMGQSWVQYQNGLYRKQVFRLKLNMQDDIFIGSEAEGVFRALNDENAFEQIGLPISRVKNMVFSGDSLIFAATPSGVQRFNRITKKWSNISLQNVEAVTITPSNYLYASTFDEGLYKSTDLGETWFLTNLTSDSLMSVYNVLAINNDTIFASTENNLQRSTNGGINWNDLPINTGFFSRGLSYVNNNLWCTGYGSSSEVLYKSSDWGVSFDSVFSGFSLSDQNNPISVTNNGYIFIADPIQNSFRGIIRLTDNGETWEQILFDKYTYTVLAKENGMVITEGASFLGELDSVYLSMDFGDSWIGIPQPIGMENYISDIKVDTLGNMFFGTYRTGLYEVDIITTINEKNNVFPQKFHLYQNYPNPFNPSTTIKFEISNKTHVKLKILDILGREIMTLVDEEKHAGVYETTFDASNLSSGIYIYTLITNNFISNHKMIFLK